MRRLLLTRINTATEPLLIIDDDLIVDMIVDRPNRFVVRIRFDDGGDPERAFLGDPGSSDSIEPYYTEIHVATCDVDAAKRKGQEYTSDRQEVQSHPVSRGPPLISSIEEVSSVEKEQ